MLGVAGEIMQVIARVRGFTINRKCEARRKTGYVYVKKRKFAVSFLFNSVFYAF